jgi:Uma2 family endonuclease
MSQTATDLPRRHRLSVEDYYRMAEVGILGPDERVELIDGEIVDMAPRGSRHAGTVAHLHKLLQRAVADSADVRAQAPLRLDRYSEPEPDLAVLRPSADYYKSAHPRGGDALLVVEVAETSLRYDRDVKVALYARFGIVEIWLVDTRNARLTRYRNPVAGTYETVDEPDVSQPLGIGALPNVSLDLRTLFAG